MNNQLISENLITLKEIAELKGVGERAVRKSYKKYKFIESAQPRGGKQILVFIDSLEPKLQEKLDFKKQHEGQLSQGICNIGPSFPSVFNDYSKETSGANLIAPAFSLKSNEMAPVITKKQKVIAFSKADLVDYWQKFRVQKTIKTKADKEFVEFYNSGAASQTLFQLIGKISLRTLHCWKQKLDENNSNPLALVPQYKYGSDLTCNTKMADIEKQIFMNIMLKNNQIKVGRAYEFVKFKLQEIGINEMSSIATYRRVWQYLNKKHRTEVVFARQGAKAARETMPSIMRDVSMLEVGDVLIADGHTVDFDIINPYTGKPQRMTLIAFIDWASWDLMGWEIMPTENTQAIASAFRNAVTRLGKLPKVVYLDNGKAFRGKFFAGCESFMSAGINGLYAMLGIKVKFTKAYNGQAKIIERFFKEFTESFAVMQDFYRGNSIDNKPAYLMRNEKFHLSLKGDLEPPTVQEFKQSFEDWLENIYRRRTSKKDKMISIKEHFESGKGTGVDENLLNDFIMAEDIRKITKDGIKMFNTFYWCEEICGMKDKVIVKYSLFDLTKLKVFSMKGVFIGTAVTRTLVHGMAAELGDEVDYTTFKAELKAQKDRQKIKLAGIKTWLKRDTKQIRVIKAKEVKKIKEDVMQLSKKQSIYDISQITVYKDLEIQQNKRF